jgi:hypothetical protein
MKQYITTSIMFIATLIKVYAQDKIDLSDLSVPSAPTFILTDITPTLVQSPTTPKKLILGLAQSYAKSNGGFPNNYSAEFTPYWFVNPSGRSVFAAVGVKTSANDSTGIAAKEDIFSGLKFGRISLAFINKDLVPDDVDLAHKVFAVGYKTTIIKIQQKGYSKKITDLINEWHKTTQQDLIDMQTQIALAPDDQVKLDFFTKQNAEKKDSKSKKLVKKIEELVQEKPLFSWDLAGAYAVYGIADQNWKSGRTGAWTTLSSYISLAKKDEEPSGKYLNLNLSARSLFDNFTKTEKGEIIRSSSFDTGGKIAFEFDNLSIGVESLYRYKDGEKGTENRTVGIINFKIAENIFINGIFGKNFKSQSRTIAVFGVNWGFGSEKLDIPK